MRYMTWSRENSIITAIGTRDNALTGDDVLISALLSGNQPRSFYCGARTVACRLRCPNSLADPNSNSHGDDSLIATNDNWKDTQEAEIIATGIPPTDDLESAILFTLYPGAYTIVVSGKNGDFWCHIRRSLHAAL